jgi:hypothetical protein
MLCEQNILVFVKLLAATQIRPIALSRASRSQIKDRCKKMNRYDACDILII